MASEGRISLVKDIVDSALYYYLRILFNRSAFAILSHGVKRGWRLIQ